MKKKLEFPVAINKVDKFENNNNFSVYILGVEGKKIYIYRKSKHDDRKKVVILLLKPGFHWDISVHKHT